MLQVKTPEEVLELLQGHFFREEGLEYVKLRAARGRVLAEDIRGKEYVPDFRRSTVDGFAVQAADTFGCSESIPAILSLAGAIQMGQGAQVAIGPGICAAVPTGGEVPDGGDAVVMLEYTEVYGDGTVGISKSVAPGENLVFRGDDLFPGKLVLPAGRRLTAPDVGALAAMGIWKVPVRPRPRVAILSTGDELVAVEERPGPGQIRDVNSALLSAAVEEFGGESFPLGIFRDNLSLLTGAVERASETYDAVVLSGGSSVGEKDIACRVVGELGELLFHGIAMKPGKPTFLGVVKGKPLLGLPGHPAAAFFAAHLFLRPLLAALAGCELKTRQISARLTESVSANHGRAQYTAVRLREEGGTLLAEPIRGKSGLVTSLAGSDGYFCIERDCEGLAAGSTVKVTLFALD